MAKFIRRSIGNLVSEFSRHSLWGLLSLCLTSVIVLGAIYLFLVIHLPKVQTLKHIRLQVPLQVFSSDGKLMAEFGTKRRIPVKLDKIPKELQEAVIATEDARYYEHPGVDFIGLVRAAAAVISSGQKVQGASTITMQVARNFFLSSKKTYWRKINEMLLALEIDRDFSKDDILNLYLNEVYLGERAYGVAAAAQIYFGKKLDQLTLPEMATIAGLPQAPSANNPIANPAAALDRRNHVLERMKEQHYIDQATYDKAIQAPLGASYHGLLVSVHAPYVAEMVRQAMIQKYGKKVYGMGMKVTTTISSTMQDAANTALTDGLWAYTKRHAYRRTDIFFGTPTPSVQKTWQRELKAYPVFNGRQAAAVWSMDDNGIQALMANGTLVSLPMAALQVESHAARKPSDLMRAGELIWLVQNNNQWQLSQIPSVQGAIVSINPKTGAMLALSGGFDFDLSHFNRAVQAYRQPGSNFKPFIFSAFLSRGATLATLVNDAPIVMSDESGENKTWRPHNDDLKFNGLIRLKEGLAESRNMVAIRVLQSVTLPYFLKYVPRFGFDPATLPHSPSLALGSGVVSPMQIVRGYSVFANGGYLVNPYFIDKIMSLRGRVLFQQVPEKPIRTITPQNAYLMTQAMKSVIEGGPGSTGAAAQSLKRTDLAGKTGTSNKQADAWFSGFNANVATSVWVGYDNPSLSLREFGAQAALPIWIEFMGKALDGQPEASLPQPRGIVHVRIDPTTGLLAPPGEKDAIFESFTKKNMPKTVATPQAISQTQNLGAGNPDPTADIFQ